ncbi:UNVERIFIED_ORG: hypothetical protein M2435_006657 [Rhizobium sophorae]|nr:hypothetical protein [Rhizobium leguminosarum]MDH6663711.1 hypothetical protein [Rhizobium sophorae]NKJ96520.1 hypothetical protein [Rhizobium leguminosarum bv. viciae]
MAGSIIVSRGVLISLNTMGLYYLIERIRVEFGDEDNVYRTRIYETLDEQGMPFIALDEQDSQGFNAFVTATKRAYDKERKQASFCEPLWSDLINKLVSDPRYAGDIF